MTQDQDTPSPTEPGPKKRRPAWKRLVRMVLGLSLLAVVFYMVPLAGVWDVLAEVRPWPVIAAVALAFVMQWAVAHRLRLLCDAHGLGWSTNEVFQINLATRFYGFLPGGNVTGILIRIYKLTSNRKHYMGAAVAMFYDRVVATVSLCGVGAVFWLMERPSETWEALTAIVAAMVVMVFGLIVLFDSSPGPVVSLIRRTASRFVGVKLHTVRQSVRDSRSLTGRQIFIVYFLSVVGHLIGVVGWYLLCLSLDMDVSLTTVGWVRSGMILATMIPISAFGLGLREGAAVLLLTGYEVSHESSVAFSLLVFVVFFLSIGLAGGLVEFKRVCFPAH